MRHESTSPTNFMTKLIVNPTAQLLFAMFTMRAKSASIELEMWIIYPLTWDVCIS